MQDLSEKNILPYWRLKTFNEKLNATTAFLKQYWRPLLKANLLVGGPLFVIGVGLICYNLLVFSENAIANPQNPGVWRIIIFILNVLLGFFFYGLSTLAITMVTFEFMKVQHFHPEKMNDLNFIFQNTKKRFPKMFGFMLFGILASYLVGLVSQLAAIPLAILGPVGVIVFFPLYILAHVALYSYVYVIAPTAYYEKISFSKTIEKGIALVKGKFWQTVGMYFGARVIQYIIITGLVLPIIQAIYFYIIFKEEWGGGLNLYNEEGRRLALYAGMGLLFIYFFLNLFTNIFHVITGAVQYHTLKEEKENNYLYSKIEQFETL